MKHEELQAREAADKAIEAITRWLTIPPVGDALDARAIEWAIDLLEKGVMSQENINSQYWLRRLARLVPGYRNYPPLTDEQMQEVMRNGGNGT